MDHRLTPPRFQATPGWTYFLVMMSLGCSRPSDQPHPITHAPHAARADTLTHSRAQSTAKGTQVTKVPGVHHVPQPVGQLSKIESDNTLAPLTAEDCADCHYEIVENFSKTGMGRSLYRPGKQPIIEDFSTDKATVVHPKAHAQYRAYIDGDGRWWQEETLPGTDYSRRVEVKYVIGSGNHTRSYLGEVEGNIVQLPLTWYSGKGIWDMSPGYEKKDHFRFDRPVRAICLFCHNDFTPEKTGTASAYAKPLAEGISCVRCHGDGRAHIQARMAGQTPQPGEADPTIFNPGRHSNQRQLQVCQQCHLAGESRVLMAGQKWDKYDPSTPLGDYMAIYTYEHNDGADFGIASHGSRLAQSACFKASNGELACTKCHNPHKRDIQLGQRTACLSCHTVNDCGDQHGRTSTDGSCAKCHMHRGGTSDIPHVTFTDHFIRKRPSEDQDRTRNPSLKMVDAVKDTRGIEEPEDAFIREAIAHARRWRLDGKAAHQSIALKLLPQALKMRPNDARAWNELAMIYTSKGQLTKANNAFKAALKADPNSPDFWIEIAENLEKTGQISSAEQRLRLLIEKRPDHRPAWDNLANLLFRQNRIEEAEAAYNEANKLGPDHALTASNRGYLELKRGDYKAAEKWFNEALRRDALNAMMYANLGTLAIAHKQLELAHRHFTTALKRDPKFAVAHWMLGRLDVGAGRIDSAKMRFQTMTEVAPKDPRGYMELAGLYMVGKDKARAIATLRRAQIVLPNHPQINRMMMHLARSSSRPGVPNQRAP